jgi:hypothetical protein
MIICMISTNRVNKITAGKAGNLKDIFINVMITLTFIIKLMSLDLKRQVVIYRINDISFFK